MIKRCHVKEEFKRRSLSGFFGFIRCLHEKMYYVGQFIHSRDCCLQFDAFRYSDADWSSSIICSRKQAIYRTCVLERKVPNSLSYKMWAVFSEDKAVKVFDSPFAFCRTIFDVSKVREFVTTQYHQSTASHSEGSSQERTYARTLTGFPYKIYSFRIFGLPDSTIF